MHWEGCNVNISNLKKRGGIFVEWGGGRDSYWLMRFIVYIIIIIFYYYYPSTLKATIFLYIYINIYIMQHNIYIYVLWCCFILVVGCNCKRCVWGDTYTSIESLLLLLLLLFNVAYTYYMFFLSISLCCYNALLQCWYFAFPFCCVCSSLCCY